MIDSTARAERLDLPASPSAFFTWQISQKPIAVRLPLPLIDRLEQETVEAFRSLTSRGSEIGGLLLGSIVAGNLAVVTVEEYELIQCDYSRGPLYRLSDADMGRFERAIEQHGAGGGLRVAGFFRSHTRKGLSLDAEDVAFFEPRFHDPNHIVMLVRPFATKASVAGIFVRENGRITAESSYQEFPFRSSELGVMRKSAERVEAAPPGGGPAASEPLGIPAVAKPAARAQIVPIASRREATQPDPAIPPVQAHPPAAKIEKAETTEAKTPSAAVAAKSAPPAPVAAKSAPSAPAKPKEKEKEKVVEPAVASRKTAAPAFVEDALPVESKNKKLRLTVAAALGMLVLVGGVLFVYPSLLHRPGRGSTAVKQDKSPLSLRVERTSGGLLLSWNRDADAIKNATKVVLSISDGDRHENIDMDLNQARNGSIVYPPISGDVSFQMQATDSHQAQIASESLRILDPRPSPLAEPGAGAAQAAQTAAKGTPAVKPPTGGPDTADAAAAEEAKAQESEPVSHAVTPTRQFNKESLAQRLRPAAPSDLPDAPTLVSAGNAAPGNLNALMQNPSGAPNAPPAPRGTPSGAAPSKGTPTASPATNGGQITAAEPIYKKAPEYPKLAKQAGAFGVVEVDAIIGVDGHVKNAKAAKGNPMLQRAAVDAVMEWRYKPALLNGKPVESPVQIRLNFVPER